MTWNAWEEQLQHLLSVCDRNYEGIPTSDMPSDLAGLFRLPRTPNVMYLSICLPVIKPVSRDIVSPIRLSGGDE